MRSRTLIASASNSVLRAVSAAFATTTRATPTALGIRHSRASSSSCSARFRAARISPSRSLTPAARDRQGTMAGLTMPAVSKWWPLSRSRARLLGLPLELRLRQPHGDHRGQALHRVVLDHVVLGHPQQ
ncbi:hypothetical protein ADK43_14500, partial [Streptomyces rimosus subsp. rimosus]